MHDQARRFTEYVKKMFPEYFINKKVLDVGSGDINGNNKFLFENCEYDGNDVVQAKNVTIVGFTSDLQFADNTFDTIISTECFEHDPLYELSLQNIVRMLKPNGLFVFTCASVGRPEHGTRRTSRKESYGTIGNIEMMQDYYKNLTVTDVNESIDIKEVFSIYNFYYNRESKDLYFVGIKKSNEIPKQIEPYMNAHVVDVTNYV